MARILRGELRWADLNAVLAVERVGKRLGQVAPEEIAQFIEGLNDIIGD